MASEIVLTEAQARQSRELLSRLRLAVDPKTCVTIGECMDLLTLPRADVHVSNGDVVTLVRGTEIVQNDVTQ